MFNLKMGDDLSALSDVINTFKTAVTTWNTWKAHIRLETVNIDADIDDVSLYQSKKLYKTMKDLGKLVESLLDDVVEENQILEMKLTPIVLRRGINSLPNEILQMILTDSVHDMRYNEKPRTLDLQLTCKRFYGIVNSSTHCWSWVTDRDSMKKKQISQLYMQKKFPIHISVGDRSDVKVPFKKFFLRNQHRIASIDWERKYYDTEFLFDQAEGSIKFPALKSLRMTHFCDLPKWNFPNLTHLYSGFIPPLGSFPLLQHWSFRQGVGLKDSWEYVHTSEGGFGGDQLLDFLDSTPRLKSLGLGFDDKELVDVSETNCVTLAGVEFLTIDCHHLSQNANKFMERLKLPQVKRVVFTDQVYDGLYSLFGQSNITLQTVKSLEYRHDNKMHYWGKQENFCFLRSYDRIHSVFPNLERLDIRTEGYLFWYNSDATYWPNLHTVTFWHDNNFWKANIAGLMANKNFASRLKRLRIGGPQREDRFRDHRVDVSIRKILGSVYGEDVLEVQSGIGSKKTDFDDLLCLRSEVGANRTDRQ